jgi:fructose-bisphosphate aldolase class II
MSLVPLGAMLQHARQHGYAIGIFAVTDLDTLAGAVDAAVRVQSPLILKLPAAAGDGDVPEAGLLPAAAERAALGAAVPVALLAPATDPARATRLINRGCTALETGGDGSPAGLARIRALTELARGCGVAVLGGPDGPLPDDPQPLQAFLAGTGLTGLSLSLARPPPNTGADIDFVRLAALRAALTAPLTVRTPAALSDARYRRLIQHGVSAIDCGAALARIAGRHLQANAREYPEGDSDTLRQGVAHAVAAEAARRMGCWGSAGQAPGVLAECGRQQPVEHVILYNLEGLDEAGAAALMADGRRILGAIPGVREVVTGSAVQDGAGYRYCWLVRFTDPAVIAGYRDHPDHRAFADQRFRPFAGGRVSIDYRRTGT